MEIKRKSDINHKNPTTQKDYSYALSDKVFHTDQLFFYSEKVRPGTCASAPHFHTDMDEIISITKGELYAIEGDKECALKEGDSICFHRNSKEKHFLINRSDIEAEFLIFRKA